METKFPENKLHNTFRNSPEMIFRPIRSQQIMNSLQLANSVKQDKIANYRYKNSRKQWEITQVFSEFNRVFMYYNYTRAYI